jgi:hypothetical protein
MVFAVDFDGTICEDVFPGIGYEMPGAISTLKALQKRGHKIIIWTCRCEPFLTPMTAWLHKKGFTPDAVNANVMDVGPSSVPKVRADAYIDNRNFPPFTGWFDVHQNYCED